MGIGEILLTGVITVAVVSFVLDGATPQQQFTYLFILVWQAFMMYVVGRKRYRPGSLTPLDFVVGIVTIYLFLSAPIFFLVSPALVYWIVGRASKRA